MRKRPFLIFAVVVGMLVAGVVGFIQSTHFAGVVKRFAAKYVPADLGIEGDFSELAVRLFPPGISIRHPRLTVIRKRNIVDLPEGSTVGAERIDLNFLPFQMFSGNIRVHKVVVVQGDVRLAFEKGAFAKKSAAKKPLRAAEFHWDELFQIHAEAIALEDTRVRVSFADPEISADLVASSLSLGQWEGKGGVGYEVAVELKDLKGTFPKEWKIPGLLEKVRARAHVNALGVQLDELAVVQEGVDIRASGTIKGNLLNPKGLLAEGDLRLKGDLSRLYQLAIEGTPAKGLPQGGVEFNGKVRGNLDRPSETFRAEGSLDGERIRYQAWEADKVSVTGAWVASAAGGEISVEKALITAQERAREGGHQPGRGGKVEAGPFKVRLGAREPLTIPLKLERAHIHWLAAAGLKDVYPLGFRVTGPVTATYTPKSEDEGWKASARLDLRIDDFTLDNQKLGKNKPLHRILQVPVPIQLAGGIDVDSAGLKPNGLTLTLPHTRFALGGSLDFKTGYDIRATGPVDFADIGKIAENDIRGEGTLSTHVHGPSSRCFVDFDVDVKKAYYLRLRLGDLKGRITYDDDPTHLLFEHVAVEKGRTSYVVDGMLDMGDADSVALDAKVPKGDIHDFIEVFHEMVQDLWWFPHSLVGDASGDIKISGGLEMAKLQVAASLGGPGWEYFGEKFKTVALKGGYDKGKYYVESFSATKHSGLLTGMISFDADNRFDWDFRTQDLTVNDLDHVARLDVPIRGKLNVASTGHGKEGALDSTSTASLNEVVVRGVPMPASELTMKTSKGVAVFKGNALGGQGAVDLMYDFNPGGSSALRAELKHLDFSPVLLLINPRMIQDRALAGFVSGNLDLSFKSGQVELATGQVELSEYLLQKTGTRFQLVKPVSFRVDKGNFDLDELAVRGNSGEASLAVRGRGANLEGSITGDVDVSLAEFLTSSISQASGAVALDLNLGGTVKAPTIFGKAVLGGAVVRVASLESPFENVTGTLQLRQNLLTVTNLEADLANGRISSGGTIALFVDRYPKISLNATLAGNKLKVYPFQFVKVRGGIVVHGEELPYVVDGSIVVESALSKEKVLNQQQGRALKTARYTPPPTLQQESDYPKFKLNINVLAENGVLIQNDLFDAELKAQVTLVNTIEAPRLLGTADMISGKMTFKDRVFQIQSANIGFDNPAVINPTFNLTATTEVTGNKIQMYASGRLDKYKIDLTSNPVLPESEILSLLALGLSSDEVRKLRAGSGSYDQGEAFSLLLHSLDFNRDVQSKTGFQIELDQQGLNNQTGTSIFQRPKAEDTAAPKIVIKRQLVKDKVDLSVGSTVGVGASNQKEVNAEVHLSPGVSVIGVWDNQEGVDAQDNRTSVGVDVRFQKRFK